MSAVLLSLGQSYTAQALAPRLSAQGWQLYGATRSPGKIETIRASGVSPVLFPDGCGDALARATALLISAGPDQDGDPVLKALGPQIAARAGHLDWVGYLSTTAVYGDHQGGWVDEETPLAPTTRRGGWRAQAEAAWQAIPGLPLHIFRLAGIYGPGRGPFAKLRRGTAQRIIKPGQVFSRIHVQDIVQVLCASIRHPHPGRIYNLCDDDPAPPQDVIAYAAELLALPVPPAIPFETAELSAMARSFYADNKRVRNDRIKAELGVRLIYPDYRAGLSALIAGQGA